MIVHDPYAGEQGTVWEEYTEYEKKFCDIRLNTGEEVGACWPNAGFFTVLVDPERKIKEEQVTHIRYYNQGEE